MIRLSIYITVTFTQLYLAGKYAVADSWWLYVFLASAACWIYLSLEQAKKEFAPKKVVYTIDIDRISFTHGEEK